VKNSVLNFDWKICEEIAKGEVSDVCYFW